jgi:UDP-N-acetylmuramyl pentapeptide synthase
MVEIFEKEGKMAIYHYDYKTLKENLFKIARRDDVVLLKGANSHCLWRLLDTSPASI